MIKRWKKEEIEKFIDLDVLESMYRDSDRLSNTEKFTQNHMEIAMECYVNYEIQGYFATHKELGFPWKI